LTGAGGIAGALAHRPYRLYVTGNAASLVGTWAQRIAVGWLAWELTGSGTWLGILALADLFPSVLIGPFAGAFADRHDRLTILLVTQWLAMLQSACLFVLALFGWLSVGGLVGLVLFQGLVMGFGQPARLAVISQLVPRESLPTAVAINSAVFNSARFVGPSIAGPLILVGGLPLCFLVNTVSYCGLLVVLRRLRRELPSARSPSTGRSGLFSDVVSGLRYVVRHPGIGPVLAMVTATALGVRPFMELLPGFVGQVLGRGAGSLAAMGAGFGLGAVVGALCMAGRTAGASLVPLWLGASALCATGVLALSTVTDPAPALALAALMGLTMSVSGISAQTLIQLAVEEHVRGRVLSLYGVIFRAGPALGALAIGMASDRVGLPLPLAIGAILTLFAWSRVWIRRVDVASALTP
jgi:MFS family permease